MKKTPTIGITLGDPQGIGPEVVAKALQNRQVQKWARYVLFGDPFSFDFQKVRKWSPQKCGEIAASSIKNATEAALQGSINALVTAPISKERINKAGYRFPGHTEFLAHLTGSRIVRLMMVSPHLKVILATLHEPISKIPSRLTISRVFETILLGHQAIRRWYQIKNPRLAVASLNPHAGEGGLFGKEEREILIPAVKKAQKKGVRVVGPLSADTVFHRALQGEFDLVVSLYHDQGLIPLKLLDFDRAVNLTVGLPIIRTSVDHGTAFDIAGKNKANPTSLIEAIKLAVTLVQKTAS